MFTYFHYMLQKRKILYLGYESPNFQYCKIGRCTFIVGFLALKMVFDVFL
jgi:hypothetical protein